jgi:hypothetical protein
MSDELRVCEGCERHVRVGGACPFCGAVSVRDGVRWGRVGAGVMLAMAASAALHACYGAPAPCRTAACDLPEDRDAQVDAGADAQTDASVDATSDR